MTNHSSTGHRLEGVTFSSAAARRPPSGAATAAAAAAGPAAKPVTGAGAAMECCRIQKDLLEIDQ